MSNRAGDWWVNYTGGKRDKGVKDRESGVNGLNN